MFTSKHWLDLELLFLLTIAVAVGVFLVVYRNNLQPQFNFFSSTPPMQVTTEVIAPKIAVFLQISPDGTKKVIMKTTQNNDDTTTYEFSTANENGGNTQHIFTKTLNAPGYMSIPFNTWSPDDKYFFIEENAGGSKKAFVFDALGVPFSETEPYLDATNIFNQKNTGNNFSEATGWASESLVIINTLKPGGTKGHSYWLEVPSRAIIQLSTEF